MINWLYKIIDYIRHHIVPHTKSLWGRGPYLFTAIVAFVITVVGINLFIELSDLVKGDSIAKFDNSIFDFVSSFRSDTVTSYFRFFTKIGDVKGYLIIVALSIILTIIVFKKWKYTIQIIVVLALASVSNLILKRVFERTRPDIEQLVIAKSLSYPSGHAMSAMAFYGFLIFLVSRFKWNITAKIGAIILLAIVILSIGISRIYLGVHYPSDIVGGYIAGLIWVVFCVFIFDLIQLFRSDPLT